MLNPTLTTACLALSLALGACSKSEAPMASTAPAATTPTTSTATTATTVSPPPSVTAAPATTVAADLPSECQAYLDNVEACMSKQPGAAAAMRQGIDQTRATWASMGANKSALAGACKAAMDAFAQQAAMMKC